MELVVVPEPDPQEREAVELALAGLLARGEDGSASRSAWWRSGVAENLDDTSSDEASY
jgi:hypothetical protein